MATFEKRPKKNGEISYRATIRIKGFPDQSATFTDEETCKQWAKQTEQSLKDSIYFPKLLKDTNTLSIIIDRYKKEYLPNLSPDEQRRRNLQLNYWKEKLGMYLIQDITPAMIKNVMDELSKTITVLHKKPIAPATLTRRLAALSHVFTVCCMKWNLLSSSPTQYVERAEGSRSRLNTQVMNKADQILLVLRNANVSEDVINKVNEVLK